jgi:hypothetical protein
MIDDLAPAIASKHQPSRRRRGRKENFLSYFSYSASPFFTGYFEMGSCFMSRLAWTSSPLASEAFIMVQREKQVEAQHVVGSWLPRKA